MPRLSEGRIELLALGQAMALVWTAALTGQCTDLEMRGVWFVTLVLSSWRNKTKCLVAIIWRCDAVAGRVIQNGCCGCLMQKDR